MRPIRRIIVHHTDSDPWTTVDDVDRWHRERGWSGIGYHVLVHQRGERGPWMVSEGRPVERVGAHDHGENADSIGVAIAGRYVLRDPEPAGWALLVQACADLLLRYALPVGALRGHREDEPHGSVTTCPGFDPARLRSAVAWHLQMRTQPRTSVGGFAGEAVTL